MKRTLSYLVGIIGLVMASTVFAQTTANGPYYATPSWDQQLPASTRFIVLSNWNNAAVLDRETGLVWERTPTLPFGNPGIQRSGAIPRCWDGATGGRKGWRLPRTDELLTLGQRSPLAQGGSPLPEGHPFMGVIGGAFWTVDYFPGGPFAAIVEFSQGSTDPVFGFPADAHANIADPANTLNVWCVRGGQASPAPAQ